MAFKINIENEEGHTTGFWVIEQVLHRISKQTRQVTVLGYKNKAAMQAGKRPIFVTVTLESTPTNMNLAAVEAAVMLNEKFLGSVAD